MRASSNSFGPLVRALISLSLAFGSLSGPILGDWAGGAMAKTHRSVATHSSHSSHSSHPSHSSHASHSAHTSHTAHTVRVSPEGHGKNSMILLGRGHGRNKHAKVVVGRSSVGHGHAFVHGHSHTSRAQSQAAAPVESTAKNKETSDIDDSQAQAQAAAEAQPRLRNYSLLGNAYALYDQGVNERLKGNFGLSTDKLTESAKLIDQASSIERSGRASTLASMVFFELGLSAEADNERGLARDSFVHAVKAKPGYVEAYLHLINGLATSGQLQQARNWLNDALRECPGDSRLTAMQSKLNNFMDAADGPLSNASGEEKPSTSSEK